MGDWIIITATVVIAVATVVYSFFNYQLWQETKKQKDISKASALMNLLFTIEKLSKETTTSNPIEKQLTASIYEIISRQVIINFINELGEKSFLEFGTKIDEALKGKGISIPEINKYWTDLLNEAKKVNI